MSLRGLVTDSSVPHTVLSGIADDTVAVRCVDCHHIIAYTENNFVNDKDMYYYPVRDVVLNEKHIYVDDPSNTDPREYEERGVWLRAAAKKGINVDAVQVIICKECDMELAAWLTSNHGANGRSTMLAIDSEVAYLTDDESTRMRLPFRSYPPHGRYTPGIARYFFNLDPVPPNWDQSKADALRRDPGIVSDVRNTLSLLQSQHRHFLLESRREKEKTSNTDWKNVSLALTTSIMEVQHERKRITELERENEELKLKISQMSENQMRSDAARRITSQDSFLVRRKRANDAIGREDGESGTVVEDTTSPCHGRNSSGFKRICHSNIRRSTTFEPVQSTLQVTGAEQENTDEEAEEQEGTVVAEQAGEEEEEEEEEDTENVIRVLESPPRRRQVSEEIPLHRALSHEVLWIDDNELENTTDANADSAPEKTNDQTQNITGQLPPSAEKENRPPPPPINPQPTTTTTDLPPEQPEIHAPSGALFLASPSQHRRVAAVPPSTTHVSPTTVATDFRFLSSDTPRTDVEVPSMPAKAVPQTAAQTAETTTTAPAKRQSSRQRKKARRGGGVSASRPNRSTRRKLNVAKMRAQKEKEKEKEGDVNSSPQREESGLSAEEKRTIKAESDARKAEVARERAQQEEQLDRTTSVPHEAEHENMTAPRGEIEAPVEEHGTEARAEDVSHADSPSKVTEHELIHREKVEKITTVVNAHNDEAATLQGESPVVLTEKPLPKTPHPLVEIHVNNSHISKKADDYPLINNFDIESPQKQGATTSAVEVPAVQDSGEGQLSGAAAAKTQNAVAAPAVSDVTQKQTQDMGQARGEKQGMSVADRIIARLEKSWE